MKKQGSIACGLLAVSQTAFCQMTPQIQQQLPSSNPNSSQYHSVYLPSIGQGDTISPDGQVRWADRWGAIATDGNGHAGIVKGMASKSSAQKAAVAECRRRGGGGCVVRLSYHNQCAAVVAGATGSNNASAATEDEAIHFAMSDCETVEGRGACRVYYSGCSLPVPVE